MINMYQTVYKQSFYTVGGDDSDESDQNRQNSQESSSQENSQDREFESDDELEEGGTTC